MQPPTERSDPVTAPTTPPLLHGDESELYQCHHRALIRAVARVVDAPRELIEDACQTAWAILLHRQPERTSIFAWLRIVAIHEAYRLSRSAFRDSRLEDISAAEGWEDQIPATWSLDDTIEARAALQFLAELPERERGDLALRVAGFSYREIAEMTGSRTLTNVSKQLAKARARVRLAKLRAIQGANLGSRSSS
jgi:RNA polymerase sigma factor (sigma-70 family)